MTREEILAVAKPILFNTNEEKQESEKDGMDVSDDSSENQFEQPAAVVQERNPVEEKLPGQMTKENYPEYLPDNYKQSTNGSKEDAANAGAEGQEGNGESDSADQEPIGGSEGEIPSDIPNSGDKADNVDGVSDGLGAAGDAGASGEVSRAELEDCIEKAWDSLFKAVQAMMNVRYGRHATQIAYDRSIDMAAALERLIMLRQKEVETDQNG